MANQIRISPEQMHSRAAEYRNEAANVGQVISKMDSLLNSLQSEWEGSASESYAQRYAEIKPSFQKAQQLIEEIAAALDKTANQLKDADLTIASGFKG